LATRDQIDFSLRDKYLHEYYRVFEKTLFKYDFLRFQGLFRQLMKVDVLGENINFGSATKNSSKNIQQEEQKS